MIHDHGNAESVGRAGVGVGSTTANTINAARLLLFFCGALDPRVELRGAPAPLGMLDALCHEVGEFLCSVEVFLFAGESVRVQQQRKGAKLNAVLHADHFQRTLSDAGCGFAAAFDGGPGGKMSGGLLHLEEEIRRLECGIEVFPFAEHLVGANELGCGVRQRATV